MGVFSWIWDLISGFFSGSRYNEEREEYKDEKKTAKLTKREERMEKTESNLLKRIVSKLEKIHGEILQKNITFQFRVGNQNINVE